MPVPAPDDLPSAVTNRIRMWLAVEDPARLIDLRQSVADAGDGFNDDVTIANALRLWFKERLMEYLMEHPDPFQSLAHDMMGAAFDFVDWEAIAGEWSGPRPPRPSPLPRTGPSSTRDEDHDEPRPS